MGRLLCCGLVVIGLGTAALSFAGGPAGPSSMIIYQSLPGPGEKIELDADHYFTYGFASKPKIGTAIMRVEIFTRDGKRDTSFVVKGDADMPSMRGAHSTGDHAFTLSAKGVYLLPVQLVMPGDWEVKLTFIKKGKAVLRGSYLFDL